MGLTWVVLAALLFGVGSVAQAAAVTALDDGASLPWPALLRHPWFVAGTVALEIGLAVAAVLIGLGGLAGAVGRRGTVLAVCSGLGFAACSTAVKLVDLSHPLTARTSAPALVAALAGALGCLWWTLALRLTTVTTATAVVVVAEVVPPSLLAPLLGDTVSSWFALVAPIALGLAATACVVLARGGARPAPAPDPAPVDEAPAMPVAA